MMYFSRIRIKMNCKENIFNYIQLMSTDDYSVHQLMWTLFPNRPKESRMFLFRQEIENEQLSDSYGVHGIPLFYVVSSCKPIEQTDILNVETKEYSPKISEGDKLAFSLRVNPIVSRKQEGKKNSKHNDLFMDVKYHALRENKELSSEEIKQKQQEAVVEWLSRRGGSSGFVLYDKDKTEVTGYNQHIFSRKSKKEKIKFSSVDISGILEVTDVNSFLKILGDGLGSSKSFGCGMMMIRRV